MYCIVLCSTLYLLIIIIHFFISGDELGKVISSGIASGAGLPLPLLKTQKSKNIDVINNSNNVNGGSNLNRTKNDKGNKGILRNK